MYQCPFWHHKGRISRAAFFLAPTLWTHESAKEIKDGISFITSFLWSLLASKRHILLLENTGEGNFFSLCGTFDRTFHQSVLCLFTVSRGGAHLRHSIINLIWSWYGHGELFYRLVETCNTCCQRHKSTCLSRKYLQLYHLKCVNK